MRGGRDAGSGGGATWSCADGANFVVGEDAGRFLGSFEDAVDELIGFGDAVAGEPINHVGFAAHRSDFNDLFEADEMRRDATVNRVGEFAVVIS